MDDAKKPKSNPLVWIFSALAILFVIVASAILAFPLYVKNRVNSLLPPEAHQFLKSQVVIPDSWLEAPPFPSDLLELSEKLRVAYRNHGENQSVEDYKDANQMAADLLNREPLSDESWLRIPQILKGSEEFINLLQQLTARADYEYSALPGYDQDSIEVNFMLAETAAQHLCLKAYNLAHDGNWEKALEADLEIFRLCRRKPYATWSEHLVTPHFLRLASRCNDDLKTQCIESKLLESALAELNRLEHEVGTPLRENFYIYNTASEILRLRRRGFPADLTTRQTGRELIRGYMNATDKAIGGGNNYFSFDLQRPMGRAFSKDIHNEVLVGSLIDLALSWDRTIPDIDIVYLDFLTPEMQGFQDWKNRLRILFDLTRLNLAARIVVLETSGDLVEPPRVSPELLPEVPVDPVSGKPYLWNPKTKQFYSDSLREGKFEFGVGYCGAR